MNKTIYIPPEKEKVWNEARDLITYTTRSSLSQVIITYLEEKVIPKLKIKAKEKAKRG